LSSIILKVSSILFLYLRASSLFAFTKLSWAGPLMNRLLLTMSLLFESPVPHDLVLQQQFVVFVSQHVRQ
jgi:hypothetical protein